MCDTNGIVYQDQLDWLSGFDLYDDQENEEGSIENMKRSRRRRRRAVELIIRIIKPYKQKMTTNCMAAMYGNTLVPFFGHHKLKKFSNIYCKVKTKSKNFC